MITLTKIILTKSIVAIQFNNIMENTTPKTPIKQRVRMREYRLRKKQEIKQLKAFADMVMGAITQNITAVDTIMTKREIKPFIKKQKTVGILPLDDPDLLKDEMSDDNLKNHSYYGNTDKLPKMAETTQLCIKLEEQGKPEYRAALAEVIKLWNEVKDLYADPMNKNAGRQEARLATWCDYYRLTYALRLHEG